MSSSRPHLDHAPNAAEMVSQWEGHEPSCGTEKRS
jgi:hypothetical protein